MGIAKKIFVAPISSEQARACIERFHYSKKVVPNSQLHFGVFLNKILLGAMSFGPSMDKRKTLSLVSNTPWNGFLELNRMAFSSALARNSESRALGVALRIIKKIYPHIKWIISYADATQCGDVTIYRASGFKLIGIKKNTTILKLPSGKIVADKTLNNSAFEKAGYWKKRGAKALSGFQIRYIYFLDSEFMNNLTVPILPYSMIHESGAGMYKGIKRAVSKDTVASSFQLEEGGANPTTALQYYGKTKETN